MVIRSLRSLRKETGLRKLTYFIACSLDGFIGDEHGVEGVKLEEQILVNATGIELLSAFPFEENLLPAQ